MNKAEYQNYLKSRTWKSISSKIKDRDKWKCRLCNSGLDLHVHHRSYEFIGNESKHLEDLITICSRCHAATCSRLIEATEIIKKLLNAAPTGHCVDFHHGKKDQHGWHEPCPVEKRWRDTMKRAEDFISSANERAHRSQSD